jgi:titin
VVNSTADSGAGTLRDCLENAGVGAKITFDPTIFPPSNPATIAPTTWLPVITQGGVTIDASNAGVILDGSRVPSDVWRHALSLDSDGNRVMGLQLTGWRGPAIAISGCWNVIGGDRSSGQGPSGQGNVISGNMHGISLDDKADHNRVIGNLIGTDVTGIEAVGNQVTGIGIAGCWNVIGPGQSDGSGPSGQGNVISGNMLGIGLYGKAAHNLVIGNLIGTDITGTKAIGNWASGIRLDPSASYNRIGGSTPQERNIISGNGLGVYLFGPGIVGNIVSGNYIGTDILGTNALGKGTAAGIGIEDGPRDTVIGGTNPGEGNVISGNEGGGIGIAGPATSQTNVIGNLIGLDASGSVALPNGGRGVSLLATAFNRIGGTSPGERNVIGWGIGIGGNEGGDNVVVGNYIGTDTSGGRGLGEGSYVGIGDARTHNFVGGSTTQERNVVGFIAIEGAGAEFNWVMGNYVGVAADGRKSLGHPALGHGAGVLIWQYAGNNVVQQNVVSGNDRCGVTLWNGAGSNLLRANRIGVAADGVSPLPNGETDIAVNGPENRIGGFRPGDGNTIAFSLEGVVVYGHPGNTIRGNSIYGHPGPGIELRGGNAGLAAPVITTVTPNSVCGTACPGCTVDVYSDSDDEGRIWEGSVTAAASTDFTFVKQGFTGPLVTATATDPSGNTSPLSSPRRTVRQRSRRHDRN